MLNPKNSLYHPNFEKENCGFGLIAQMDNQASHWLVKTAIQSLSRLTHRGAVAADGKTGDGCGLLLQKPDQFLRAIAKEHNIQLQEDYAIGMLFLHQDEGLADLARETFKNELEKVNLQIAGWRIVPINKEACGEQALETLPRIEQVFINANGNNVESFERKLYLARRTTEIILESQDDNFFYIASLSSRLLSYKGLVMPEYLPMFYPDLQDERMQTALCVFHQRFSTNTSPQWRLAQPFRYLAHNGEINTISGNRNWAQARASILKTKELPSLTELNPLVSLEGSDSCSLDNMFELLQMGNVDMFRAMRLLVPPAWQNIEKMDNDLRAFYEYNSMHMEPWDGPAGLVFTNGRYACCALDRNGLRPARWVVTKDRHITLASEIGVYDYDVKDVVLKGRLKPGDMIAADTETGQLLLPDDVDTMLKQRHPYRSWMEKYSKHLKIIEEEQLTSHPMPNATLNIYEKLFQVTFEERDQVLRVLAENGQEAVGSMGDDTPIAPLSSKIRPIYDYFRQQFAQVTNPAIDPIRESIVMSLETCLGPELNIFEETADHAGRLVIESPILSEHKFQQLLTIDEYPACAFSLNYQNQNLEHAIEHLCDEVIQAVSTGKVLIVLSDKAITRDNLPIPAAMATGAVHHCLLQAGLRCHANIIVETATARDPHHFAVLIGYGATAVYPYLAYESLQGLIHRKEITKFTSNQALENYRKGIHKGLLKILSKMGISTIASYRGAQLFEIIGLDNNIVEHCFRGTSSRIQGASFNDIESEQKTLSSLAWNPRKTIDQGGVLKYIHNGEYHAYNPDMVQQLHKAVSSGDYQEYLKYADLVNNRPITALRDLLTLREDIEPIDINEVEAIKDIVTRFDSAAMSLGALSPEAHQALAMAMNELGGRSNSGEGGEDPSRYGTIRTSKIKQIASGRFGVTPHYLSSAEVLQIKVAQGAKPGEGGQLPGHKVNVTIAKLRYCKPGVALISPPPHHDIYSIEDLAQLIFDLKQVNPQALVSVKLVSEPGVGTIAAGVAKAYADLITISGHDGGTGASPLTSVRYAGSPWELGLTETQQVLRANNLRHKIRLQTDGGLKTGLDVIKAAILGAESFGFGTGPMVAMGCKYLRICHLNNCATGVATQDDNLRHHLKVDAKQRAIHYFSFIAQEIREWMAKLGVRKLTDLVGRTDLLKILPGNTKKQKNLDLSHIVSDGDVPTSIPRICTEPRNPPFDKGELAEKMVKDMLTAIEGQTGGSFNYNLQNTNRSIGARISGEIAKRYGNTSMEENPIIVHLKGIAGQSFGVWNAGGLHLYLEGEANDYTGKGMAGGKLVLYPAQGSTFDSAVTPIMGNTCLYGATGGVLYAAGTAGERFAVRNSGAIAVIEGLGDHGCEYMTGGVITILGKTGINFGAGMTGGFAFIYDKDNSFVDRYNHELIDIYRLESANMETPRKFLYDQIAKFVIETKSKHGQYLLDNFAEEIGRFWLVKPKASEIESLLDILEQAA